MSGFAEYLSSGTSGRLDVVNQQIEIYSGPYRPGADFYHDFVQALREGRARGADELCLRRCVASQAQPTRKSHYSQLSSAWLQMLDWHLEPIHLAHSMWEVPELAISVSPHMGLRLKDGRVAVVRLWLKESEPTNDAIRAMQWLLCEQMTAIHPNGVPVVLDLRRHRAHVMTRRPFKRGYENAIRAEAAGMGALWRRQQQTA